MSKPMTYEGRLYRAKNKLLQNKNDRSVPSHDFESRSHYVIRPKCYKHDYRSTHRRSTNTYMVPNSNSEYVFPSKMGAISRGQNPRVV